MHERRNHHVGASSSVGPCPFYGTMHAKLYFQIHSTALPCLQGWQSIGCGEKNSAPTSELTSLYCVQCLKSILYIFYIIYETFFFRERLAKRYEKKDQKEAGSEPKRPKSKSRKHSEAPEVETAPSKRARKKQKD